VTSRKLPTVRTARLALCLTVAALWAAAFVSAQAQQPSGPAASRGGNQSSTPRLPGPPGYDWWNDTQIQKEIGLTPVQVRNIDRIYRTRSSSLQPTIERYTRELKLLDDMTRAATADESTYRLQALQVESLRSEISLSRTVMLYRFFKELQPEQHTKLRDIFEKRAQRMMRDRETPGRTRN
jgi:Spy/CpxP family protein refolding chaperone